MSDDKPPTQRLGRLTSGVGKNKDGVRLGSLKGDGAEAGLSAGTGGSNLATRFKPKNFNKAEQGPVPETKLAEPSPDPNARRSHRNTRSDRGRGGGTRGGGRSNYESEVVFGGMVGAGASVKIDVTSKKEPGYKTEPLSGSPTTKPTKRLVKASGAVAGEGGASGSKQKKKGKDVKSESESGFSSCSSSDKDDDDDDDDDLLGDDDEYLPTLLASLGKNNGGGNNQKQGRSGVGGAAASKPAIPEELMARPPESEIELSRQLAWLTEQNVESAGLALFQLPSVLPIPVPHQSNGTSAVIDNFGADGAIDLTGNGSAGPSTSSAAAAAAVMAKAAEGRPASLAELPPGKIGKLLVLRNGSVKMQIGEVLFDVSPGIPCQMLQEFAAVDPSSRTITMLGEIEKRIIVTPNIDSLLSDDPLPEWKYANKNARGAAANGKGREAALQGKKKKSNAHAVLIDSESSSSSDDEEMVDVGDDKRKVKNGVVVVEMIEEDDDEATEDEEPKKKSRPAPKARRTGRK